MRPVAIAMWVLVSCGGATFGEVETTEPLVATLAVTMPADDLAGLVPGEAMRFEVKIAGVLAGEAQFAVGDAGMVDGVRAIAVSSRIASAGAFALLKELRDEATSMIALDTQRPLHTSSNFVFGDKSYQAETTYQDHASTVRYQPVGGAVRTQTFQFGDDEIHDAHTAMARVRAWRAEPNDRLIVWMIGGRRIWRTEVSSGGSEVIGTYLGNQAAIRLNGTSLRARPDKTIDPTKPPRDFSVWLSDDADRVPLRIRAKTEFGELTIELVDYRRP